MVSWRHCCPPPSRAKTNHEKILALWYESTQTHFLGSWIHKYKKYRDDQGRRILKWLCFCSCLSLMASPNVEFKETSPKSSWQQQQQQQQHPHSCCPSAKDTHGGCAIFLSPTPASLCSSAMLTTWGACYMKDLNVTLTSSQVSTISDVNAQHRVCYARVEFLPLTLTQHRDVRTLYP